jgi:hypothetical protein
LTPGKGASGVKDIVMDPNSYYRIASLEEGEDRLPFLVQFRLHSTIELSALADSCCAGSNFIHHDIAQILTQKYGIKTQKLDKPLGVSAFDGRKADLITEFIEVDSQVEDHNEKNTRFLITNLGNNNLILGRPWLRKHGAVLDMTTTKLLFYKDFCNHEEVPESKPKPVELAQESRETPVIPIVTKILKRPRKHTPKKDRNASKRRKKELAAQIDQSVSQELSKPDIRMIGIHALRVYQTRQRKFKQVQEELGIFAIRMEDIMAQHQKEDEDVQDPYHLLPEEYHDIIKAFSKQDADSLPNHGPSDHHIELLPGRTPDWICRRYKLSQEEFAELRKWINENLSKSFIEASKAPFASPILFVKKPGGGVRLCIDYRKLNEITKKDKYPLPLVDEILGNIQSNTILTKLDIRKAFNRIRMQTEEDEELTTFMTPMGNFKSKVLGFGLTNGPASFQRKINEALFELLGVCCDAFMDDVLIYSPDSEQHTKDVRAVLKALQEAGLQCDIRKCEFSVKKVKFLGLIVSTDGIEMDPEKIKVVVDWKQPTNATEVLSFTGFCNFYRRFIKGFSSIAKPLFQLTLKDQSEDSQSKRRKYIPFTWNNEAETAFQTMKDTITSAPILRHFDPSLRCHVEVDSSDYTNGGVLSQEYNGIRHPVAFFSRKLSPTECNYEIYDKELLAIVTAFEEWRPELVGTEQPIEVLTDHKALEYFMTTKKLTRRQARWALLLSEYNFEITYIKGKQNGKADALTRKPGDRPEDDQDERQRFQHQVVLPKNRLSTELQQALVAHIEEVEESEEPSLLEPLADRIREAQALDETCSRVLASLEKGERSDKEVSLAHCEVVDKLLVYNDKVWVPKRLRTEVIRLVHDGIETAHPGLAKTMFHVKKSYYWPAMWLSVSRYIRNCHTCKRSKASRNKKTGHLNSLPVPDRPWRHISMDFVTNLAPSKKGNNAIEKTHSRTNHFKGQGARCAKLCEASLESNEQAGSRHYRFLRQ